MAQVHDINGNTINYISFADWLDTSIPSSLDGLNAVSVWRNHIWEANVMPASEWNTLEALEGQQVSITTTDYSDRNSDYLTYYNAVLTGLTGNHEGPNREDVRFEFLVKV